MAPRAADSPDRMMRLRLRLRPHVKVHRHLYRGRPWVVLEEPASGRAQRVSGAGYRVIELFDGQRSLAAVLEEAQRRFGDDAPGERELVSLVGALYRADLLSSDALPDLSELATRGAKLRALRLRQSLFNPLALRFALVDPDRFLAWLARASLQVPGAAWGALWLAIVGAGAAVAAMHWKTLSQGILDSAFSLENLVLLGLCYPLVKLLHEIGHGIVVRRNGGQVHEMGVMLLVLMPVPYVDASSVAAFRSKWARMGVGAAGVATELFIAGGAMLLWAALEPGTARAVCFNVALIAGVSTLVFNGNPLLRFDAYYVLADWLEIPNLGARANAYIGYLAQRHAFGLRDAQSPAESPGEAAWLLAYGLLSGAYRVVVVLGIVLFVATQFFFFGVLLAIWGLLMMVARPMVRGAWYVAASPQLSGRRGRPLAVTLGGLGVLAFLAFAVPAPQWTRAEGVVWAPEDARVRAGTACFVTAVRARHGERVERGDPLLECEDIELAASVRSLEAQLVELQARDHAYYVTSRLHLDVLREEIAHTRARLADARRRLTELTIRSPAPGRLVLPNAMDMPGRFLKRGELVGYVLEAGPATVRVVIGQDAVDLVRGNTLAVALMPADRIGNTIAARLRREIPGASERLPSRALAVTGGGAIAVDPRTAPGESSAEPPRALAPVFQFDLEADAASRLDTPELRVHVRFTHDPSPVAQQVYRAVRRQTLRLFQV